MESPCTSDCFPLETNLYSRQIYALGESAVIRLRRASVLVSGIGSVGVEIAKNLAVAGVGKLTVHDTRNATWADLSAQYYLLEEDIGKNRAAASFLRLSELNNGVKYDLSTEPLTEDFVKQFQVVVLTDAPLSVQLKINSWIRSQNGKLLVADARGLFAYIFTDFGTNFRINDVDGEPCKKTAIRHVDRETGEVTCHGTEHHFMDGDYVTFKEIRGMTELNNIAPIKVKVSAPWRFNIGKIPDEFGSYIEGGTAIQVKVPSYVSYKTLAESLIDPEFAVWDITKSKHSAQLHLLWQALYVFEEKQGRSPFPRCDSDVELLRAELLKCEDTEDRTVVESSLVQCFSYQASGNLVMVASLIGGIAAHEAVKAITHHTTPIKQYLYVDCLEALPGERSSFGNAKLTADDCKPANSRYDGQVAVFGKAFQEALAKQQLLIVGSGAIGCEVLKNLAMMGVACGKAGDGIIKIVDMGPVKISNLAGQFLFRRCHIGCMKSAVAATAVLSLNSDLNIQAFTEKMCNENEGLFSDDFFVNLNCVFGAVDNFITRNYVDRRCIYYGIPFLDSDISGTKGRTLVVYPHLTETYRSFTEPREPDFQIGAIHNFSTDIRHTALWARDLFWETFTNPADIVNEFLADEQAFFEGLEKPGRKIENLCMLKRVLVDEKPSNAEECILWARKLFQEKYYKMIVKLLHHWPENCLDSNGAKFWSGSRRCPHVVDFDPNKEEHFTFVYAASILRARQYCIKPILGKKRFHAILHELQMELFEASETVNILSQILTMDERDQEEQIASLKFELATMDKGLVQPLAPMNLDLDNDLNYHMEFITAASNLRAECYDIQPEGFLKTKQIVGQIVPAVVTSAAAVAGLATIELLKMVVHGLGLSRAPLGQFRNGRFNLALPFFAVSEPVPAIQTKVRDKVFTVWDCYEIQGPKTLREIMEWVQNETKAKVELISVGVRLIYSFFMDTAKKAECMDREIRELAEEPLRKPFPEYVHTLVLEILAINPENEEDVDLPFIKYHF